MLLSYVPLVLLYVNNMILLGNFYYRNWNTLTLADNTSWSEIEKHLS